MRPAGRAVVRSLLGSEEGAVAYDSFTAADGTTISGRVLDTGQTWTVQAGTWSVESNRAKKTNNLAAVQEATCEVRRADTWLEADFLLAANDDNHYGGLVARFTDANNYWRIALAKFPGSDLLRIEQYEGAVRTIVASMPVATLANQTRRLRARVDGSSIRAIWDTGEALEYSAFSFNLNQTKFGVFFFVSGDAAADYTLRNADNWRAW